MSDLIEQQQQGLIYRLRDYIAGSIGGITQVLIGQPFDTIKVRMQSSATKTTIQECLRDLIAHEGLSALYKGVASPLLCMSGVVSIQFGVFQNTELQGLNEVPIYQVSLAGFISGLSCCAIVGPMENIRIKMQMMKTKVYNSTLECAVQVYRQYGIKGVYKGITSTILREAPGEGLYFMTYEAQMRVLKQYVSEKSMSTYAPMFAGGNAGLMFWLCLYPVDTLKSRMQGDNLSNPKYTSLAQAYSLTIREEGFKALYKGLQVCALRSIPVNAFGFLAFEQAKLFIERRSQLSTSLAHH